VNTIQPISLVADQAHSRPTVTFSVPVPPAEPYVVAEGVSAGWHRSVVGAVTSVAVDAELPHALETSAASHRIRRGVAERLITQR
jgi:hypothetical protein